MEAHKQGRDTVLISNEDVGTALSKACEHDADNDVVHLARAANIVRRDMFKMMNHFSGSLSSRFCASFSLGTSCYGVEWTKHQSTVDFIRCLPTSPHQCTPNDAQQFCTTLGELGYKHNQAQPRTGNTSANLLTHDDPHKNTQV